MNQHFDFFVRGVSGWPSGSVLRVGGVSGGPGPAFLLEGIECSQYVEEDRDDDLLFLAVPLNVVLQEQGRVHGRALFPSADL